MPKKLIYGLPSISNRYLHRSPSNRSKPCLIKCEKYEEINYSCYLMSKRNIFYIKHVKTNDIILFYNVLPIYPPNLAAQAPFAKVLHSYFLAYLDTFYNRKVAFISQLPVSCVSLKYNHSPPCLHTNPPPLQ